MLSVAAALAQRGERGDGVLLVRRATAGRGGAGLLAVAGRELFQLAGELGDDLLGHALADAVEAGEEARVLRLDGVCDLARARGQCAERLARAAAFDGGEGFEELLVLGAEEADERGLEPAARGVAGEVEDRVQREVFAEARLELGEIGRGDEQLVQNGPGLERNAIVVDAAELTGKG